MPTTDVSIGNRALQRLGATRISSLTQDNPNARSINSAYDPLRQRILRSYNWNFAKARASVAADATQTAWGALNRYQVPNDFIHLIRPSNRVDWTIEGRFIISADGSPLQFMYIFDETNTANFDPLFSEAFACLLAYECCEEITGSTDKRQLLRVDLKDIIQTARTINSFERDADLAPPDDWLVAMLPGNDDTPS